VGTREESVEAIVAVPPRAGGPSRLLIPSHLCSSAVRSTVIFAYLLFFVLLRAADQLLCPDGCRDAGDDQASPSLPMARGG
jgi:hypothetical protein